MKIKIGIASVILILIFCLIHIDSQYKVSGPRNKGERSKSFFEKKRSRKLNGSAKVEAPQLMTLIQKELRTADDQKSPKYSDNYLIEELNKAEKSKKKLKAGEATFTERGPSNVAGRTRAVLVYLKDKSRNTWLAASVSGGIWKTTDAGQTWVNKTSFFPNLGTNTLAFSQANPDIVYAGTGEHFTNDIDGAGMFKSLDFGETWSQIVKPDDYNDFRNISRIIVDPNNPDIIVATTRNSVWADSLKAAVYKSYNGGVTWQKKLESDRDRYDDLNFNPSNFMTQYIAIDGQGVIKSTDGGESWTKKSSGLQPSGRVEIDISAIDTNVVWASVEGSQSGNGSDLYITKDGADNWSLVLSNTANGNVDFLGGQGWYDNIVKAHPFRADQVYVGGINLWKFALDGTDFENTIFNFSEVETQSFLSFVNGNFLGGGIDFGDNISQDSATSLEIRFGQGTQMAHRFTVDQRGPGVPALDYRYLDYVEVPFQVWDTDNDRQLMVSFRDQQEDGVWNLLNINTDAPNQDDSREYIFVHNVAYNGTPDPRITTNGGHEFENMYFMWPFLTAGASFIPDNLPFSSIKVDKILTKGLGRTNTNLSDAYFQFDQKNTFSSFNFENNLGMHPDQHDIVPLIEPSDNQFRLLVANDGGLYVSKKSSNPGAVDDSFDYAGFGYNTTQFYSADKAPGKDRYIGGMQDNSTWFTPANAIKVDAATKYDFAFGGDGFEAIWNNRDEQLILGSIQFNSFQKSRDGGASWRNATTGMEDVGQGRGPFISRLANSKSFPDRVFTLGSRGVWVSNDFGDSWESIPITNSRWSFNNSADVEVSLADFNTVWAGGALSENSRLFVSVDGGNNFSAVNYYDKVIMGRMSGLATHPTDPLSAYAIFSFSGKPKILQTRDIGQTWNDITGFEESNDGKSTKGFPDVAVNTLFVFPNDTNRIWAGTEIGIVESTDNGTSWNLLDNSMGAVNIYDFMLQDDQIVIATYGRGIWTAEVEGLASSNVFPPVIVDASVAPDSRISVAVTFNQVFDSTQIFLNGVIASDLIVGNLIGDRTFALNLPGGEGENIIELRSFINNQPYKSNLFKLEVFIPSDPVEEYVNAFSNAESATDFFGGGFSVRLESGFQNPAIHSDHPYLDGGDITYILKKPIRISENQIFSYRDVAIVEPGEVGTVFGDLEFYDYVVVEGSLDGSNWEPIVTGYDARANTLWFTAFNNGTSGSSNMFQYHEVDLSTLYNLGDLIFIRYRLSADPAIFGWGWAIDDVKIEKQNTTPIIEVSSTELNIYPNPVSDILHIDLNKELNINKIDLYDFTGILRSQWQVKDQGTIKLNTSNFLPGNYLLVFSDGENQIVRKLVIQ